MCMKFYQKSSKLKRLLKSIWEFVIVFKVAFFITPTMISTRNLFYFYNYHECSSMIAFMTSKSYQPCFLRPSGVLPAGIFDQTSAQVKHTSDSEANITDPTFSHLEAHLENKKTEAKYIPTNQWEGSQILLLKPLNQKYHQININQYKPNHLERKKNLIAASSLRLLWNECSCSIFAWCVLYKLTLHHI